MPSRTDSTTATPVRLLLERGLRVTAVITLLLAWWLTGQPSTPAAAATERPVDAGSVTQLANAVTEPSRTALHAALRAVPDARTRSLLHAAQQAGLQVSWSGNSADTLTAMAMSASPLADPMGGVLVRVSAPDGTALALADSLGWLDSAVVVRGGLSWPLSGEPRELSVSSASALARAAPQAFRLARRVRLFAEPGWEARFAMRALEDAGWTVDATFDIAPRVSVTAGAPAALDTSRYAAVIALDSTAWPSASAIVSFVRSGGGLVLFPAAASGNALAALRVGGVGAPAAGVPGAFRLASPREGLPLRAIVAPKRDAVILERSARTGNPIVMAGRVVGAGRVVQVGWMNSWEWRMLGGENAVAEHRDWWRALLHRTARISADYAPFASPLPGDAAPYADLVARLGASSAAPTAPRVTTTVAAPPPAWLFVVAAFALLAEWWSRRLRGVR